MHKYTLKIAGFLFLALLLSSDYSYAKQSSNNAEFEAAASSDLAPKKKEVNELDKFIRKTYLAAESFFASGENDLENIPLKGIYIKAADEVVEPAPLELEELDLSGGAEEKVVIAKEISEDPEDEDYGSGIKGVLRKRAAEKERERAKEKGISGDSSISEAIYWDQIRKEYSRRRAEERKAEKKRKDEAAKRFQAELKDGNPIPKRKPENGYRIERLPSSISKKVYSKDNAHLPKRVYEEEYKSILFGSVAEGDLDKVRAMIRWFGTTEVKDNEGNTPLLYAVMAENIKSTAVLLGMGAGVNVKNNFDLSPLYVATKLKRVDLVASILKKGANPDISDKDGRTPLMIAAENDSSRISELLIKKGANVNKRMKNGDTAIHIAARNNSYYTTYLLMTSGAGTEIRNFKGHTPIMTAANSGSQNVSGLLLKAGADISKRDAMGRDPKNLASINGFTSVAELIESEKINRRFLAENILREKSTAVQKTSDKQSVPFPQKKPFMRPGKNVPEPFFSEEERSKM